jgi:hypothetical protein
LTFTAPHTNIDSQPVKVEPTRVVEFLLHKSLLDKNPTIVKRERNFSKPLMASDSIPEVLYPSSDTNEILWNFSLFKGGRRLTLEDNPHFYEKLPTSAKEYGSEFQIGPIETLQLHHNKISILTDDPRLKSPLFLETSKGKRAFGNIWAPRDAIIFKGSYFIPFCVSFSHPLTSC